MGPAVAGGPVPTLGRPLPARAGAPPRPRPSVRRARLAARGALGPRRVPAGERAGTGRRRRHHVLPQAAQTHLPVLPAAAAPGTQPSRPARLCSASGEPPGGPMAPGPPDTLCLGPPVPWSPPSSRPPVPPTPCSWVPRSLVAPVPRTPRPHGPWSPRHTVPSRAGARAPLTRWEVVKLRRPLPFCARSREPGAPTPRAAAHVTARPQARGHLPGSGHLPAV